MTVLTRQQHQQSRLTWPRVYQTPRYNITSVIQLPLLPPLKDPYLHQTLCLQVLPLPKFLRLPRLLSQCQFQLYYQLLHQRLRHLIINPVNLAAHRVTRFPTKTSCSYGQIEFGRFVCPTSHKTRTNDLFIPRLLADAIKVQEQIADCEDRIALAEQTQQTSIFDSLTSTQKTRHQQELANLTAQLQADTEALDTIIGKLAALSDGWPKKPSHSQEVEAEIENQYQDITRYVQDLKATADKMQAGLNEISEATSKEGVEEKEPEPSEMELALDRLVVLESKLGTVANEYISRDRDIKEEISYKLATSMDKLRRSTLRNIMKDDPAILAKERVEADINGTREQVEILSNEIADLVTRLDNMNVELTNSRQANYEWKEVYERVRCPGSG